DLHGAALELPEGGEDLLGGLLLQLPGHGLSRGAAETPPEPDGGPAGDPQRQARQSCHPCRAGTGQSTVVLAHLSPLVPRSPATGCRPTEPRSRRGPPPPPRRTGRRGAGSSGG